jgi:hypothetical protein
MLSHTNSECYEMAIDTVVIKLCTVFKINSGEKLPIIEYTDEEIKTWYYS